MKKSICFLVISVFVSTGALAKGALPVAIGLAVNGGITVGVVQDVDVNNASQTQTGAQGNHQAMNRVDTQNPIVAVVQLYNSNGTTQQTQENGSNSVQAINSVTSTGAATGLTYQGATMNSYTANQRQGNNNTQAVNYYSDHK